MIVVNWFFKGVVPVSITSSVLDKVWVQYRQRNGPGGGVRAKLSGPVP